jgi:hypothetical protein
MTLEEIDNLPPNGFHDAQLFSIELDYAKALAKLHVNLLIGLPDDPEEERSAYQEAIVSLTGLCFCSIEPPCPDYPFVPGGGPTWMVGDRAKPDHLPSLPDIMKKAPEGTWSYRFFVNDWNAFIYIAARDAELSWIGEKPKHAR